MTETEKIVAWLLAEGEKWLPDHDMWWECGRLATAIERGDHLVWRETPTIPASEWVKTPSVGH